MRVRPVGADALLLEVDDPAAWFAELWRRREAGQLAATEIVPGARTVLLDGLPDQAGTIEAMRSLTPEPVSDARADPAPSEVLEIGVDYGGEDLAEVAAQWGTDEAGVVARLSGTLFLVAFCGFAPGFAYLAGLPEELAVPRLDTPRHRVPAGSVALADAYAGIYPTASPGGWRLVGQTDAVLFDPDRDPPALLVPGTRVRLRARS
jgi:KipI family sensor histidine kinase inhibitor